MLHDKIETDIEHGNKQSPLDASSNRYWPGSIAWHWFHLCLRANQRVPGKPQWNRLEMRELVEICHYLAVKVKLSEALSLSVMDSLCHAKRFVTVFLRRTWKNVVLDICNCHVYFDMRTACWSQEVKSLQFAGSMKTTVAFGGSHVDSFAWPVSAGSRSILTSWHHDFGIWSPSDFDFFQYSAWRPPCRDSRPTQKGPTPMKRRHPGLPRQFFKQIVPNLEWLW